MWSYVLRRLLYNIPVYLGVILLVMLALRVNDPVYAYLGKGAGEQQIADIRSEFGLDRNIVLPSPADAEWDWSEPLASSRRLLGTSQYLDFVWRVATIYFSFRSWEQKRPVADIVATAVPPTLMITVPTLVITAGISIVIGLVCAANRGRSIDKTLMLLAVLGMSVSYLVYIILGQYFGAYWLNREMGERLFAIEGYDLSLSRPSFWLTEAPTAARGWVTYCLLPVLIGVVVAMGYDTRFYRAVMVEETHRDYVRTARAKGASKRRVMFKHMLRNALIPIVTRVMASLPFVITGSILVEVFFNIPGMGRTLIGAIVAKDFPVVQTITALFAAALIVTVILTDVLYAIIDPRVRLS